MTLGINEGRCNFYARATAATGVAEGRALAKHKPQSAPPCAAPDGVGQFDAAE